MRLDQFIHQHPGLAMLEFRPRSLEQCLNGSQKFPMRGKSVIVRRYTVSRYGKDFEADRAIDPDTQQKDILGLLLNPGFSQLLA